MFTFLCPENRVDEAVVVLTSIKGIKVFPYEDDTFQIRINSKSEIKVQKKVEIAVMCTPDQVGIITAKLSKRKIAGYDASSTILFRDVHTS